MLVYGTQDPKEALASKLARPPFARLFQRRDNISRGHYFRSPPWSPDSPLDEDVWIIQDNIDEDERAEPDWPAIPTLLYLETSAVDERARELHEQLGLVLLYRRH